MFLLQVMGKIYGSVFYVTRIDPVFLFLHHNMMIDFKAIVLLKGKLIILQTLILEKLWGSMLKKSFFVFV